MSDGPCILFKRLLPPLTRCIPRVPVDSDLMDRRSFPVRAGESRNAVQRGIESRRKKLASVRKIDASAFSREIHEFSSARRHSSLVRDRARHTRWHFQFSGNYSSPPPSAPHPRGHCDLRDCSNKRCLYVAIRVARGDFANFNLTPSCRDSFMRD